MIPYVFFDNGILRNVLRKNNSARYETFIENINNCIVNPPFRRIPTVYQGITTPMMVVEFSGQNFNSIIENPNIENRLIEIFNTTPFSPSTIIESAISYLRNEILSSNYINYNKLLKNVVREKNNLCGFGASWVENYFESNLKNTSTVYRFSNELALDELQSFDFKKVYGPNNSDKRLHTLNLAFSQFLESPDFNVPTTRLIDHFYTNSYNDISYRQVTHLTKNYSYDYNSDKNHYDRLDTHLIHYACMGTKVDNQVFSVNCFTTEKLSRSKNRCHRYKALLKNLEENHGFFKKNIKPMPGRLYQVDQNSGKIIDTAYVRDL